MDAELISKFSKIDTSNFLDFDNYKNPLEQGLWVLWVAKEKLENNGLSAEQISSILRECKEISISPRSIINSFSKAKEKIDRYKENDQTYFTIMKSGKNHLRSIIKKGNIEIFYFESEKPFSNKRFFSTNILTNLNGELKIVDPYCDIKSLEIVQEAKSTTIKFLTRIANLNDQGKFLKNLQDFKKEFVHIEVRDYPDKDIHDRYIIYSDGILLLGHSIKDLGTKESFAISLKKDSFRNLCEAINESFDRKWKKSKLL